MNAEKNINKSPLHYINLISVILFTITSILLIACSFISDTNKKSKLIFINGDENLFGFGTQADDKISSGLSYADLGSPCITPQQNVDGLINLPLSYQRQECDKLKNLSCYGGIVKGGGICLKTPGGTCETTTDCVPVIKNEEGKKVTIMCIDNICSYQGDTLNRICSDDLDCKSTGPFSSVEINTNHKCFINEGDSIGRCKVDIYPRDSGCYFDSDCYKYDGNETKCSFEDQGKEGIVTIDKIDGNVITVKSEDNLNIFFTNLEINNNIYLEFSDNNIISYKVENIDQATSNITVSANIITELDTYPPIFLSDPSTNNGVCVSKIPSTFQGLSLGGITFPCKEGAELENGICENSKSMVCDIGDDILNLNYNYNPGKDTLSKQCLVGEDITQKLYENRVFDIFPSLYEKLKTTGVLQYPVGEEGAICTVPDENETPEDGYISGENGCKPPYQCITVNGRQTCRLPIDRQTCIGRDGWNINYCNEGFDCKTDESNDLTYFYNPNICLENNGNPIKIKNNFFVFSAEENKYNDSFSLTLSVGENLLGYYLNRKIVETPPTKTYLPPTLSSPSMVSFLTNKSLKIQESNGNEHNITLNRDEEGVKIKEILFDQDENLLIFYSQPISTVRIRKIPFRRLVTTTGPLTELTVTACFNHGLLIGMPVFYVHETNKDFEYISPTVEYEVVSCENSTGNVTIQREEAGEVITILDSSPPQRYNGEFFYTYENKYDLETSLIENSEDIYGPLVAPDTFFKSGDKLSINSGDKFLVKTIQMAETQEISVSGNIEVTGEVYFNVYTDNYTKLQRTIDSNNTYFSPSNRNVIYQGILLNSFYDTSEGSVPVLGAAQGETSIIKTPLQFTSGNAVVTLNKDCVNYGLIILKKNEYTTASEITIKKNEKKYYLTEGNIFVPNGMNNSVTYAFDDTEKISFSVCKENEKSYFLVNKEIKTFNGGNINLLQKVRYLRDEDFSGSGMEYKNTVGGNIFFTYENTTVSPMPSELYFDSDTREDNKVDVSRIYDFSNNITGEDFTFINTYINDNNTKNPFFSNKTPPVGIISHMGKMNYTGTDESYKDPVKIGFKGTSYLEDKCKPISMKGKVILGDNIDEFDTVFNADIFTFKNQEDIDVILNNPSSEIVISVTGTVDTSDFSRIKSNVEVMENYGGISDNFFYIGDNIKKVSQNFIITEIDDYNVTVTHDVLRVRVNVSENNLVDSTINTNPCDVAVKKNLLSDPEGQWNFYVYNIYPLEHKRIRYKVYNDTNLKYTELYNIYDASGLYTSTKNDDFFNKNEFGENFNKTSFNKILFNSTDSPDNFSIYNLSDGYGQSYALTEDMKAVTPQYTGNVSAGNSYETSQIVSRRGDDWNFKDAGYNTSNLGHTHKWMALIADNFPYSASTNEEKNISNELKESIYSESPNTALPDPKYWTFSFSGDPSNWEDLKTGGGASQKILPYFFNLNWPALIFTHQGPNDTQINKYNGERCMNYLWGRNFISTQKENEPDNHGTGEINFNPDGIILQDIPIIKAAVRPTFSGIIRIPGVSDILNTQLYAVNNLFLSTLQKYSPLQNVSYNNKPLSDLKEDYVISTKVENGKFKVKGALNLGVDTNSFYLDETINMNLTNQILFKWPDLSEITNNPTFKNNPVISKTFFENKFGNFDNSISYYALVNYPIVTRSGSGELFSENIDENERRNYLLQIVDDISDKNYQKITGIPIRKDMYEGTNLEELKKMQVDQFTGNIYGIFTDSN